MYLKVFSKSNELWHKNSFGKQDLRRMLMLQEHGMKVGWLLRMWSIRTTQWGKGCGLTHARRKCDIKW
jgi:hypothetical protein